MEVLPCPVPASGGGTHERGEGRGLAYFMVASTLLITAMGTWVTEAIVEPRLAPYAGPEATAAIERLRPEERRGLIGAGLAVLVLAALLIASVVPEGG